MKHGRSKGSRNYRKPYVILVPLVIVLGMFFYSRSVSATTLEFSVSIGFIDGTGGVCSVTYNGNTGPLVKHVNPGDDVTINYTHDTVYPVNRVAVRTIESNTLIGSFAVPYGGSKTVAYENVQESFMLRNTPDMGEYCGAGGHGANSVEIYVDEPTEEQPQQQPSEPVVPSTPKKRSTTQPQDTPAPAATESAAEDSSSPVQLGGVTVGGKTVDTSKPLEIKQTEPLVLSGQSTPNATVTLTIHSTPRTVTVKTDAEGKWSYTVKDLEPGDHYVEASVTNPETGETSAPARILSFKVAKQAAATTAGTKQSNTARNLLIGFAALVAAAAVTVVLVKKQKIKIRLHR